MLDGEEYELNCYYDGSVVRGPKILRRQIGRFYDAKKVRNTQPIPWQGLVVVRPQITRSPLSPHLPRLLSNHPPFELFRFKAE